MHASVAEKWHEFSAPLEGRVASMYVDVKGLVTTAVGILIDPVGGALQLPWRRVTSPDVLVATEDDPLASAAEIAAAWNGLKAQRDKYAKLHWKYAAKLNTLRLSDAGIDAITQKRLLENVAYLRRTFTKWDELPADAQLGILSMAWAVGPGFTKTFGNFTRCALAGQWGAVIMKDAQGGYACKIREAGNPGVVPRNERNRLCFANADVVARFKLDPTILHWPEHATGLDMAAEAEALEARRVAAEAKREADEALDRFVREEFERVRLGLSSGAALRHYEDAEDGNGETNAE